VIVIFNFRFKFDIAIPDSFLYGVTSDIDKTFKIFQLSRSLSIFRVDNIFIFHDKIINPKKYEANFIVTLLEYLDTPQYLRRKIYAKLDFLKHVGKLHPIRSPHHKDKIPLDDVESGETRVGILEKRDKLFFVDVGLESLIKYHGSIKQQGKKINVKLLKRNNTLTAVDVRPEEIAEIYWGYNVFYSNYVGEVLKKYQKSKIILTSRYSEYFKLDSSFPYDSGKSGDNSVLIVFGSPKYGLNEIFIKEKMNISNYNSFNFFPYQGTQTVRLEEAIFGVLSILNIFINSKA
jgi:predicted SPOUT superfamily RNA methylase MTH1